MKLGLGGSPTGPAGTGKTESVKALGSILGRRVLVFNCDEGLNLIQPYIVAYSAFANKYSVVFLLKEWMLVACDEF